MKNLKQRITAILLALIQMLTLVAPGSIALAEGETITSDGIDQIGDSYIYYTPVQAENSILAELGEEGYQVVVEQNNDGTVSYASKPLSQIVSSGFEGFGEDNAPFVSSEGTVDANSGADYNVKIAQPAETDYESLNNAFNNTDTNDLEGGKYNWTFSAKKGLRIAATPSVVIDYVANGEPDENASQNMDAKYYLVIKVSGTDYYAPISVIGSEAILSEFKNLHNDESFTIPENSNQIQYASVLKYTGDGELKATYMWENVNGTPRYYYDPDRKLENLNINSNAITLGKYDYSFNPNRDTDGDNNFHVTATKKPAFDVKIQTFEHDGETEITPNPHFGNGYYLRVAIKAKNGENVGEVIGWNMLPINWTDGPVTELSVEDFVPTSAQPKVFYQNAQVTPINFEDHEIELRTLRICQLKDQEKKPTKYSEAQNNDAEHPNTKIDDAAPEGYTYYQDPSIDDDGSAVIKLKQANDVKYHVRLKFDTTKVQDISVAGGLYVKVTVQHKTGPDTYAYVKVTDDMVKTPDTENGSTYIDIQIDGETNKWLNQEGHPVPNQTFTGYEKATIVELFGVPSSQANPTPNNPGDKLLVDPDRPFYVNKFALTHYPITDEDHDRIRVANAEPYTDYIYDVVELKENKDSFSSYKLENILNGYNVVTLCKDTEGTPGQGDVHLKTHQMGGMLVRGDLIVEGASGIADSTRADNPTVIGGKITGVTGEALLNTRNVNTDIVPLYLGNGENTVIGRIYNGKLYASNTVLKNGNDEEGGNNNVNLPIGAEYKNPNDPEGNWYHGINKAGSTIVSNSYINWDQLRDAVENASEGMKEASENTIEYTGQDEITISVGANISISGVPNNKQLKIRIRGTSDYPDPAAYNAPATVVNFLGNHDFIIPEIRINDENQVPGTKETGEGISLIFNYPDCDSSTTITGPDTSEFGHVIAPNSLIHIQGGNYSGCMVGNNAEIWNEGHLYPYRGNTIVGFYGDLKAEKTIDGKEPTEPQKYQFIIKKLRNKLTSTQRDAGDYWESLDPATNEKQDITFSDISFYSTGKYYFLIKEDTSDPAVDDDLDESIYLVECEVGKTGNTLYMKDDSFKYYLVNDSDNLVVVSENGGKIQTSINTGAVEEKEGGISWTAGQNDNSGLITTPIEFKNKKIKNGLNIKKEVDGDPATDPEFNFNIYLWNESEVEETTVYDFIDLTENSIEVEKTNKNNETSAITIDFSTHGTYAGHDANAATFTLKKDETINITGILAGTHYAVVERVNDEKAPLDDTNNVISGYTLKSVNENTNNPETGITGTISQSQSASISILFTNKYNEVDKKNDVELKILKVKKEADASEANADGVKFTLSGTEYTAAGETKTFTLTEDTATTPKGYSSKSPWTVTVTSQEITHTTGDNNEDITVYSWAITKVEDSKGTEVKATNLAYKIVNERKTGEQKNDVELKILKVKKEADASEANADGVKFTLSGTATGTDGTAAFTLSGDQLGKYTAAGEMKTFTLTETNTPAGYESKSPWTVTVTSQMIGSDTGANNEDVTVYNWAITEVKDKANTILTAGTLGYKIVNERIVGDLEISKTVVSDAAADADQEFTFTIELSDKTISGEYGDMTFEKGVATVELKGGESAAAKGLPTGIDYTVTEAVDESFEMTKTGDTGTIVEAGCEAAFTNTRKTGDLKISKEVVSDAAADAEQEFTFTIELSDKTISGTYGDMTFEKGVATVELKGGESATATGLPTGIDYTVTEAVDENFEVTKTGDTGTIDEAGCEASFTNTRKTGNLEISKTVVSSIAADADQKFTFTIELSDKTISGTYGDMTFEKGIATIELKGGESATAEGLPTGIDYQVTEATNETFNTEKTGDIGTIVEAGCTAVFTNTRKTANVKVSKVDIASGEELEGARGCCRRKHEVCG